MKKILFTALFIIIPVSAFALIALPPNQGGTGTLTAPTIGQVLVGQLNGTYAPQATSTLGITGGGGGSGTVTSITASSPLTGGTIATSGPIGCQTASGSQAGCLSSSDWTTFNNKQVAGSYLTSEALYIAASSTLLRAGTTTEPLYIAASSSLLRSNSGDWAGTWQTLSPSYFQIAGAYLTNLLGGLNGIFSNSTTTNATTTTLAITGLSNTVLAVNANGTVISTTSEPLYAAASSTLLRAGTTTEPLYIAASSSLLRYGTSTSALTEGSNLFYTQARVQSELTNSDNVIFNVATTSSLNLTGTTTRYNGVITAGVGIPYIVAAGSILSGTSPATVFSYTTPASPASGAYLLNVSDEGSGSTNTFQTAFHVSCPLFGTTWAGTILGPSAFLNSQSTTVCISANTTVSLTVLFPTSGGSMTYDIWATLTRLY